MIAATNHTATPVQHVATSSTIGQSEAGAIITILTDMTGTAPTAAQVVAMSSVMSQGMLEVGYAAEANHNMPAGQVATEIATLADYGSSNTFLNTLAPTVSLADAMAAISNHGNLVIPSDTGAVALGNINMSLGLPTTASAIDAISHGVSNGMMEIGYASTIDPFLTAGEVQSELFGQTIYGGTTAYQNEASTFHPVAADEASAASLLIGQSQPYHIFG